MEILNKLMPRTAKLFAKKKKTPSPEFPPVVKAEEISFRPSNSPSISINQVDTSEMIPEAKKTLTYIRSPSDQAESSSEDDNDEKKSIDQSEKWEPPSSDVTSFLKGDNASTLQFPIDLEATTGTSRQQAVGVGEGDISHIHYESSSEPEEVNRCWTIKDFVTASQYPTMLNAYIIEFGETEPVIKFKIGLTKKGLLYIRPQVDRNDVKRFGAKLVKYGVSLGPHMNLGEDFSLESKIMKLKELKASRLKILDKRKIMISYLVDGNLNLIIRFYSYSPVTKPVEHPELKDGIKFIKSCSQFSLPPNRGKSRIDTEVPSEWETADEMENMEQSLTISLESDSDSSVPENENYRHVKSKPLRRSAKSEFLIGRRRSLPQHNKNEYYYSVLSKIEQELNQTL